MGLVYAWLLDPESFPLTRDGRALVQTYLDGLGGSDARKRVAAPRPAAAAPRRRAAGEARGRGA